MHRLRYTGSLTEAEFHERCARQNVWYHSFYFDNGFTLRGDYNVGASLDAYGFPEDMTGMRVLDAGTGAGWFAFLFEQRGAEVWATDARGKCDLDVFGRWEQPEPERAPERFDDDGHPVYDSVLSGGFWVMREILGSGVRFRNARIYDLHPDLFGGELFDLVFLGAVLCHLRDPIGGLMAARRCCRGQLLATTPVVLGEPEGETLPRQYLPYTGIHDLGWWLPNEACFRQWFLAAGFARVNIDRQVDLLCDVPYFDATGRQANQDQIHRLARAWV
jgi:tRNA (mo5U34)-methyltransferase